jgi:hypothetical protein
MDTKPQLNESQRRFTDFLAGEGSPLKSLLRELVALLDAPGFVA